MRVARVPLLASLLFSTLAQAAPTESELDPPYAGVRHFLRVDSAIPARAHILEIELSSAELTLVATAEADRGLTTSAWAAREGVHIAVNGDLFDPFGFRPRGLAFGGGHAWSDTTDDGTAANLRFDQAGGINHVAIDPPEVITAPEAATTGIVGGRPLVVAGGAVESLFGDDPLIFPYDRGPRTAVGVSEDGLRMILLVADGWQASSLGMTLEEVGRVLHDHGAWTALALDSGSSSTLYIRSEEGLVNSPSDGVERMVANHLGLTFTARPPGEMRGVIFGDSFDGPELEGAIVRLDDGTETTTSAGGFYSFPQITPRYTCATADADGYNANTGCVQVPSAAYIYNSIILYSDDLFIDAGPDAPEASDPDARPRPDGSGGGDGAIALQDGGHDLSPGPFCGCRAARRGRDPGCGLLGGACLLLVIRAILRRP